MQIHRAGLPLQDIPRETPLKPLIFCRHPGTPAPSRMSLAFTILAFLSILPAETDSVGDISDPFQGLDIR
jgi:hypothetical protein